MFLVDPFLRFCEHKKICSQISADPLQVPRETKKTVFLKNPTSPRISTFWWMKHAVPMQNIVFPTLRIDNFRITTFAKTCFWTRKLPESGIPLRETYEKMHFLMKIKSASPAKTLWQKDPYLDEFGMYCFDNSSPESVFLESLFDYNPFHEGNTHTGHSHCNALDALFEH